MSGVAVAIGTATVGGYSAYTAHQDAKKNRALAREQGDLANEVSQRQLDLAEEQWQTYMERILPLEEEAQRLGVDAQQLALQRGERDFQLYNDFYAPLQESFATDAMDGIQPQYDRVARDAAATVDTQFNREEDMSRRALERRGVRPDSGQYEAVTRGNALSHAAARADQMNTARENERDRVETTNFNRKATALGRTPVGSMPIQSAGSPAISPAGANSLFNSAANGFRSSQANFSNLANQSSANSAAALTGGITAGANIYSAYRPQPVSQQFNYEQANNFQGNMPNGPEAFGPQVYADGGPVLSRNYAGGGEVSGPPGRDRVPAQIDSPDGNTYDARLTDGEYVIPLDVVMAKGTDFFDKLIEKHHQPSRSGGNQKALARRAN